MKNKKLINYLCLLGVLSVIFYLLHDIVGSMNYPGYNWMSQAVSDLTAKDAPSFVSSIGFVTVYKILHCLALTLVCILVKNEKKTLRVGIYLYTMAINEKDAKGQAKWIVDILKKEKLDFPIVFDFESWSDFPNYKISTYDITNTFLTFKKYLNKHGYDAMLYSSMNYLNKVWMFNDTYDVWLAHYIDQTTYQGKYKMWQIASDGKIDGINNDVDRDIYYKEGVNK